MIDKRKFLKAVMLSPLFLLRAVKEEKPQLVVKDCVFHDGLNIDENYVKGLKKG